MSRQLNRNPQPEKRFETQRRDAASSTRRHHGNDKEMKQSYDRRELQTDAVRLDRYGLNDLYERSSF